MTRRLFFLVAAALALAACERNPVDRLVNPNDQGGVPQFGDTYVIFDDELKTGGGVGLIPGGENQTLDFRAPSDIGSFSIQYVWNGKDVFNSETGEFQHLFAGFALSVTELFEDLAGATGKDLSGPGYTTLRLRVRGALSQETSLRIEGPDDGAGGITPARTELTTLGPAWQDVTLAVPAGDFANVKTFMTVTFQYDQPPRTEPPGEGGTVFLDDVRYVR